MTSYILYTKRGCAFCDRMKQELDDLGINYEIIRHSNKSVYPLLTNKQTNETVFQGLPKRKDLIDELCGSSKDGRIN